MTVGEFLKNARAKKEVSLNEAEKKIKIRAKFLSLIEENRWNSFSSKIYIEGIIKNYAEYLNLDPVKMLAFFRRDYERHEEIKFKKKVPSAYLRPETRKYAVLAIVSVFILFFAYFAYQVQQYISPPQLTFISPSSSQQQFTESRIKIYAKVDKDAQITIFGERIYPNKDGVFEYDFPLDVGRNELIVDLVGANGKKATIKKVYYRKSL